MGVIRRQSIQTSIFTYFGMALGYVNVVLLFPKFFEPEQFGLTRVLIAVVTIASRFAVVGSPNSIIRFLPKLQDDRFSALGLLRQTLMVVFIGLALVAAGLLIGKPWILDHYRETSDIFVHFYYLLFPLLVFEVAFQVLTAYLRAMYRTVIGIFYREVFLRACTSVLIALYYLEIVDFNLFMLLFTAQYGIISAGLALSLRKNMTVNLLELQAVKLAPPLRNDMLKYGVFTFLSGIGSVLAVNIDIVMIGSMAGLGEIAFYSVAVYVVALIRVPYTALSNVATPVVADAWKKEDTAKIQDIYSRTSINQLVIGTLLFVGIWANELNIFRILPPEYESGKWVLFIVGVARLLELAFGIGNNIITLSKWYMMDVYANALFLVLAVLTNYMLIPKYGIVGAAIATAICLTVLNLIRFVFLRAKFGFNPFSWKSLVVVLLGWGSYIISTFIPVQENLVVDICIRSAVIVVSFVPLALILNLSEDINQFGYSILKQLRR